MSGLSDDPCPPPCSDKTDQRNVEVLAQTDDTKASQLPLEEWRRVAFAKLLGLTLFAIVLAVRVAIDPVFEMGKDYPLLQQVRFPLLVFLFLAAVDKGISHYVFIMIFAIAAGIIHIVGSPIDLGTMTVLLAPMNPGWIATTFSLCYTVWQVGILHQGQPIEDSPYRLSKGGIEFRCYQATSAVCALVLTIDVVGICYYLFGRTLMVVLEILSVREFGDLVPKLSCALCWIFLVFSFSLFAAVAVSLWLPLWIFSEHITPVTIFTAKISEATMALTKILKDGYSWGSLAKEIAGLLSDEEDKLGDFSDKKDVDEDTSAQGAPPSLGQSLSKPLNQNLRSQQAVIDSSTESSVGESTKDEWEVVEGCTSQHKVVLAWTAGSAEQDSYTDDGGYHQESNEHACRWKLKYDELCNLVQERVIEELLRIGEAQGCAAEREEHWTQFEKALVGFKEDFVRNHGAGGG